MNIKTIKVKAWGEEQGDFVVINEEDFNPDFHSLLDEDEPNDKPSKGLNVEQLKEALAAKGIEVPEGAKKADLAKLLDEAE